MNIQHRTLNIEFLIKWIGVILFWIPDCSGMTGKKKRLKAEGLSDCDFRGTVYIFIGASYGFGYLIFMARMARVVAEGMPNHITQRGNRRQPTFFSDDDYKAYIDLMAEW